MFMLLPHPDPPPPACSRSPPHPAPIHPRGPPSQTRSRLTKDNPFSISPVTGVLAPYGRATVTVRYAPEDVAKPAGFSTTAPKSDATARSYDFLALVELMGWVFTHIHTFPHATTRPVGMLGCQSVRKAWTVCRVELSHMGHSFQEESLWKVSSPRSPRPLTSSSHTLSHTLPLPHPHVPHPLSHSPTPAPSRPTPSLTLSHSHTLTSHTLLHP